MLLTESRNNKFASNFSGCKGKKRTNKSTVLILIWESDLKMTWNLNCGCCDVKSNICSLEKERMTSQVDLPLAVAAFCWKDGMNSQANETFNDLKKDTPEGCGREIKSSPQ